MRKMLKRIDTPDDVARGLAELSLIDPRLAPVVARVGEVPLRRVPPGFASLAGIVVSQQVSRASADAILGRLTALVDPLDAVGVAAASDEVLREAGLSTPKIRTLRALSRSVADDGVDLEALAAGEGDDALAALTALHGIGPWSAEVYLLSCAGHPDVFPAHDVALQSAAGDILGIAPRPDHRDLAKIAESWRPWRAVAARLLWAHYRLMTGRDAAPAAAGPKKAAKTA